jgi:hypothetical protein
MDKELSLVRVREFVDGNIRRRGLRLRLRRGRKLSLLRSGSASDTHDGGQGDEEPAKTLQ